MPDRGSERVDERDTQEAAEAASQRILAAVSQIDRSSPTVLRMIRDNLEVERMIDRTGRPRRRLLRLMSEYCDRRIREKERDPGMPGRVGGLRSLMTARHRTTVPPERPS